MRESHVHFVFLVHETVFYYRKFIFFQHSFSLQFSNNNFIERCNLQLQIKNAYINNIDKRENSYSRQHSLHHRCNFQRLMAVVSNKQKLPSKTTHYYEYYTVDVYRFLHILNVYKAFAQRRKRIHTRRRSSPFHIHHTHTNISYSELSNGVFRALWLHFSSSKTRAQKKRNRVLSLRTLRQKYSTRVEIACSSTKTFTKR